MTTQEATPGLWMWSGNQLYSLEARQTLLRDVTFWNLTDTDKRTITAAPAMRAALSELHALLDFEEECGDDKPLVFDDWSAINAAFKKAYAALNSASVKIA